MEIEAKYSVLDPETAKALAPLSEIAGFQIRPGETRQIRDTYMDTPDERLMAAGYACRRRDNGSSSRINLKGLGTSEGTVHRRQELSATIDEATLTTPMAWPQSDARETVLRLGGDQELIALFEIRQERRIRYFVHPDRGEVAELSLDEVTFHGGKWDEQATELEIELLEPGTEDDLMQIVTALAVWPGLVPQPTSKFERGLGLAYRHGDLGQALDLGNVQRGDTIGEAARKLLRPLFLRMQIHEQGTYLGENPEELHDMRVMTRRIRTVLRIAEPHLVREQMRAIRKGLRKTAHLLGAVRDMDVFRQKTEAAAREAGVPTGELARLIDVWNVEYARRRNEMLNHLNSPKYGRFKQRFWAMLNGGLPESSPPARVQEVIRRVVAEQLDALLDQGERVARPKAPLSAYHQLRIDVKHLRYTLTFFRDLLGPETDTALDALEDLQDYFGDLQDAVVAVMHLRAVRAFGTWEMPLQPSSLWQGSNVPLGIHPAMSGLQTILELREAEVDGRIETAMATWQALHERDLPALIGEALRSLS